MAKPSFIPTFNRKPVTATVPPQAETPVTPVVKPPVEEQPQIFEEEETTMTEEIATVEKKTRRHSDKERKTPNRQMNDEDIKFVAANIRNMSYTEIANARGLTKHQVNRVLMKVKKDLRQAVADDPVKLASVNAYIAEQLTRPEDTQVAGRGRSAKVQESIDSVVSDILSSLQIK